MITISGASHASEITALRVKCVVSIAYVDAAVVSYVLSWDPEQHKSRFVTFSIPLEKLKAHARDISLLDSQSRFPLPCRCIDTHKGFSLMAVLPRGSTSVVVAIRSHCLSGKYPEPRYCLPVVPAFDRTQVSSVAIRLGGAVAVSSVAVVASHGQWKTLCREERSDGVLAAVRLEPEQPQSSNAGDSLVVVLHPSTRSVSRHRWIPALLFITAVAYFAQFWRASLAVDYFA